MASRRAIERAAKRAAYRAPDVRELADKLYEAKRRVYRRSLLRMMESLGYQIARPQLSDEVEAEIRDAANQAADQIATTFNRDLARFAAGLIEKKDAELDAEIRKWKNARTRSRARPIAITEAYEAHTDALLAGARAAGIADDAEWDFGGHPSDADPVCSICEALVAYSPWTTAQVAEIGTPHPQCRQDWHLRGVFSPTQLPGVDEITLGTDTAGVLGTEPLITRAGGRAQAVDRLIDMRAR